MKLSKEVALSPGTDDFQRYVAELYRRQVAPALLELKEIQAELNLASELSRHTLASSKEVTAGFVALAAIQALNLDAALKTLVAFMPALGKISSRVLEERRALNQERRSNRFLFLYEAERRLRP